MAIELIDKIKQKNGGTFKLMDAEDIAFGEHSLTEEIDSVKTQLSQKSNQAEVYPYTLDKMRVNTSSRLYSSPVVTFIDDDGTRGFLTITKPVFDEYGIVASIGVIPSKVGTSGYMSEEELKELQNNGYSMLSHSYTHAEDIFKPAVVDVNGVTDEAILDDYKKGYEWMAKKGFNGADTIVYPWGGFADSGRYKNLARTFYNNGINASGGGINEELNDNMYLNRLFINKSKDIQVYKTAIDDTISKGGWLILGTHSNANEIDTLHLKSIIDYIISKNIAILPFNEANQLKGNAINIGEYTSETKFFVSKRGKTSLDVNKITNIDTCVGENGYVATSSIKSSSNGVINGFITLTNSTGNGVFTNQLTLARVFDIAKLPMTAIIPCTVTTTDSKVISTACVLNPSNSSFSIKAHGTLDDVNNVKRIDLNFTYIF